MFSERALLRNFKGGSWDLRKDERRKAQQRIAFPDRRLTPRRNTDQPVDHSVTWEALHWVTKSKLDE